MGRTELQSLSACTRVKFNFTFLCNFCIWNTVDIKPKIIYDVAAYILYRLCKGS